MRQPLDLATLVAIDDDALARTVDSFVGQGGHAARTIAEHPRATVEPRDISNTLGRRALADLEQALESRNLVAGLAFEGTLGEGGMGIVRLATQRALGRRVAVKTLRADTGSEQDALRLLREAWVTGALEHPNIVPVHDLGLDEKGAPVIVLKRIEGVTWDALLTEPARVSEQAGPVDVLEYHLRIFVQVCRALSLAHARGVLHRDLKPDNVMIGSFGEVYLVDWGIAVSLRDDPSGRLPMLNAASALAGTPAYMAPEMLGGGQLDERTDVYLLGSVLHEILTGRAPHQRDSLREIVGSILSSEPRFGGEVPPELAAIATRAMKRNKEDRYPSVDELRSRVEWYLGHRGSLALSASATGRLVELRGLAESGGPRDAVYRAYAEAAFGFRQAVAASADNAGAREGLRETAELAIRYELAYGTPEGAEAALAELPDAPAELATRVAKALALRAEERARLATLGRELDPTAGGGTRVALFVFISLLWTGLPLVGGAVEASAHAGTRASYLSTLTLLVVTGPLLVLARKALSVSWANRRFVASYMVTFALQLALEVGMYLLRVPREFALVMHLFAWFASATAMAVFIDRKLMPATFAYLVAFIVAARAPDQVWNMASAANFVLFVNIMFAWWSSRRGASHPATVQPR